MSRYRKELVDIYRYAIETVKPESLVRNVIKIQDNHLILFDPINKDISPTKFDLKENQLHIIGGGKCVLNMAKGLAQIVSMSGVNNKFSHGCLSVPMDLQCDTATLDMLKCLDIKTCFGSSNNLPDKDSINACRSILDRITVASNEDKANRKRSLFIVLISGGGSACLTSPKFIKLERKLQLIRDLVERGANIIELNKVRRYYSDVKGGQLARHIIERSPDSRIISLILSDVIGDPVEFIASGPTYIHTDDLRSSMLAVLTKYGLEAPSHTLEPNKPRWAPQQQTITNMIIGNNRLAIEAATRMASQLGYHVDCAGNDLQGSTQFVLNNILSRAPAECSKCLVIGGGEATVTKLEGESWGKGGRCQEMAMDYVINKLSNPTQQETNIQEAFLAASTDGQDGPTDVAACFATNDNHLVARETCNQLNLNELQSAKKLHDSYNFWTNKRPDWLIKTGLTGTNVMDLYFYLRVRDNQSRL